MAAPEVHSQPLMNTRGDVDEVNALEDRMESAIVIKFVCFIAFKLLHLSDLSHS